MVEKCHPDRFLNNEYDSKFFLVANRIYGELTQRKGATDNALIELRNEAIKELGIHFSTKKKYDYLLGYLHPGIYTKMNPYPTDRVAKAESYYRRLEANKNDIIALEKLETAATQFISERNIELAEEEKKRRIEEEKKRRIEWEEKMENEKQEKKDLAFAGVLILVFLIFMIIAIINKTN